MKTKWLALITAVGLAILSAPVNAGTPAVTVGGGYPACLTKRWLEDYVGFYVSNDKGSMQSYEARQRCVVLREGLKVYITEVTFTKKQFVYNGFHFWTVTGALKSL